MYRRSLLASTGWLSLGTTGGCLDTITGGSFGEADNPAQLSGQRGDVVRSYEDALTARNDGIAVRSQGIEAFNDEAYERSIGRFETAVGHFETALQEFSEATNLSSGLGEDEATSICESAAEETDLQLAATEAGLDAALAAQDGEDAGNINDHVERYRNKVEQAEAIDVADPQALADVLQSG